MPTKPKTHGVKSKFVRSKSGVAASEVVRLAKEAGIKLTEGHVYNIRSADKKKATSGTLPKAGPKGSKVSPRKAAVKAKNGAARKQSQLSSSKGELETQVRTSILRIGLDRAKQIFSDLESTLTN